MKPSQAQDNPMFTLITGGSVYAPDKLGRKDILIAGGVIARIGERIDLPEDIRPRIIRATSVNHTASHPTFQRTQIPLPLSFETW